MIREIKKNYADCSVLEKMAIEQGFAKTIDAPAGMRVSSQLLPEQIYTTISRIVDQSKILKLISNDTIKGTTADLNCWAMSEDGTVRPAPGTEGSTPTQNLSNVGNKLTLLAMQEMFFVSDTVLQEKLDQPDFENTINNAFIAQAGNNLGKLAVYGNADTGGSYIALQTGFPTLFTADSAVVDVVYATYTTQVDRLAAMLAAMPDKYADNPDLTFFVNRADYLAYGKEKNEQNSSGSAWVDGEKLTYLGMPIEWIPNLPASKAFLTDPKNLWVVFSQTGMSVETERKPRMFGSYLVMNYMADFGYVNGAQIVYAS